MILVIDDNDVGGQRRIFFEEMLTIADMVDGRWSFGIVRLCLFLWKPNKKLSHSSQLLRPFTFSLKHEKLSLPRLGFSLSFAFLPRVDGGSQFGKTVLFQQNVNIACIFSHWHPIIFCPLPHHPHNVLHLKDKCFPKYMNCKVVFRVGVEFQY